MKRGLKIMICLAIIILIVGGCTTGMGWRKPKMECNDKKDNDGDGYCDYDGCRTGRGKNKQTLEADPDCDSATDNKEASDCTPTTEVCDGKDNDCDGSVDEGLSKTDSCGVGECANTQAQTCTNGNWGPACTPGAPGTEVCDGKDNDCDGSTDEGLVECSANSDCGSDGFEGTSFCKYNNLYKKYRTHTCSSAGNCNSACSSTTADQVFEYCPAGCLYGACLPGGNTTNST